MDEQFLLEQAISSAERLQILEESIRKQQKLIDELNEVLLATKTRRNACVPISCLPPEILVKIFSFAQLTELDRHGYRKTGFYVSKWISLTYVCRHWRNIALAAPDLWVGLPISKPNWVEEMVKRSQECGLVIDTGSASVSYGSSLGLRLALQYIHRITELSMTYSNLASVNLPPSAPQLDYVILKNLSSGQMRIRDEILCETPRLRHLELTNCRINLNSHHLLRCRTLTVLKLLNVKCESTVTGNDIVHLLTQLPDLQILVLCNTLPSEQTEGDGSWGHQNLHLPHLQILHIESSGTAIEGFFRCVAFPPTAKVQVFSKQGHLNSSRFSNGVRELARSYSNGNQEINFQSMIIRYANPKNKIRIRLYTEVFEDSDMIKHIDDLGIPLYMRFIFHDTETIPQLMHTIFNCGINLLGVKRLYYTSTITPYLPDVMACTLGRLPLLNSAMLKRTAARPFLEALVHSDQLHVMADGNSTSVQT
ncbi:hypothetical protein BDN70DRAFT_996766 [Pholiota conissans]|uniref:F-box domain-containing protein n=1 Tax=Pholiota conissans TaxID=109636 RepID=A0A9P6CPQ2_9AGAR|nr:hypothetical protein BDN70DRAFT_996766 [Pholiota conissans]